MDLNASLGDQNKKGGFGGHLGKSVFASDSIQGLDSNLALMKAEIPYEIPDLCTVNHWIADFDRFIGRKGEGHG